MNRIIKIAAAAAALSLAGAGIASAKDDIMVVRLGDLNVHSQAGAQVALRRIRFAAVQFCGPVGQGLSNSFEQDRCAKRMTSKAVAALNVPTVTALYTPSRPIELAQTETTAR